jgi:hypothetical protein
MSNSRLATHTFEIRPSLTGLGPEQRPDELMIDWGNVPRGSAASIYLPAVAAAEVLGMAALMYPTHNLAASDAHTLSCAAGGITYVPIPTGTDANFAGLFSVQLPPGVHSGQQFEIVVRQITGTAAGSDVRFNAPRRRYVYGAFKITIPVSTPAAMLIPEEQLLSVMRWIQKEIPPANRWYPVFLRYLEQIAGRVIGLGGDPGKVPATPGGNWPGLGGTGPSGAGHGHGGGEHAGCTGKVDGIVYDYFGDFEAFIIETRDGEHRRFTSREAAVLRLVRNAWEHRDLLTIIAHHDHPGRPLEIILRGPPPASEE